MQSMVYNRLILVEKKGAVEKMHIYISTYIYKCIDTHTHTHIFGETAVLHNSRGHNFIVFHVSGIPGAQHKPCLLELCNTVVALLTWLHVGNIPLEEYKGGKALVACGEGTVVA